MTTNAMSFLIALILWPIDSELGLYMVLFGLMVLGGAGLPVPEEFTLLLGGFLSYLQFTNFWSTFLVLLVGAILGDMVVYLLGKLIGYKILPRISRFKLIEALIGKASKYFYKYGAKVIMFSRPLVGVRPAVLFLAGHYRVNFSKFFYFDTLITIPWTFSLFFLSYYLGTGLDLITEVKEIKHTIYILLGIFIVFYAAFKFVRSNMAEK